MNAIKVEKEDIRPSSSYIWSKCPASVYFNKKYKEIFQINDETPQQNWGAIAHMAAAKKLNGDLKEKNCSYVKLIKEIFLAKLAEAQKNDAQAINRFVLENVVQQSKEETENFITVNCHTIALLIEYYIIYLKEIEETQTLIEAKIEQTLPIKLSDEVTINGTPDAIYITKDKNDPTKKYLHVIDFKTGSYIVNAYKNKQLMLYAIGAYDAFPDKYDAIYIHIVQPSIENYDQWEMSASDIEMFRTFIADAAKNALSSQHYRYLEAGKHCNFCKAKPICPIMKEKFKEAQEMTERKIDDLTNDELHSVLEKANIVESYCESVRQLVTSIIKKEESFKTSTGKYILADGRRVRKFTPTGEKKLQELIGEQAYTKAIIGITEARKLLSEADFNAVTTEQVYKKLQFIKEGEIL